MLTKHRLLWQDYLPAKRCSRSQKCVKPGLRISVMQGLPRQECWTSFFCSSCLFKNCHETWHEPPNEPNPNQANMCSSISKVCLTQYLLDVRSLVSAPVGGEAAPAVVIAAQGLRRCLVHAGLHKHVVLFPPGPVRGRLKSVKTLPVILKFCTFLALAFILLRATIKCEVPPHSPQFPPPPQVWIHT